MVADALHALQKASRDGGGKKLSGVIMDRVMLAL